ncbi:ACP synthase [Streptomyces sp. NPDC002588]|uniref:RICIN domain-containing protein n=1 Tax=Streptomyces sp. NPDC002588 TaxID=3154419 RepID=UPI00332CED3A
MRFVRRGWAGILAFGLSLGLTFLSASPASAYVDPNFLRNWETGRCLDSNAAGDVYTLPCQQGNAYQTWRMVFQYVNQYDVVEIQNQATWLCLTQNFYGELETAPCGEDRSQLFYGVGSGWDNVQLLNVLYSTQCLDSNYAGSAYLLTCNGGGYQHWKLGY